MDIRNVIKSRKIRNFLRYSLSFMPDSLYLRIYYFAMNGHMLHLKNPKGYNEKLQWLKLHDKHPEYSVLVDKYRVRQVIAEKLGEGYLFPLLGNWESFDDINFDELPNEFVLKCNHDSGSVKIINDKSALTPEALRELKEFYDRSMSHDFFYAGREYPYKGIKPCILAEKLMKDEKEGPAGIKDYKFFCFDGVPKMMFVATDRSTDCRFDFFDMDFNHLPIENIHPNAVRPIQKPALFEEMKEIAAKLSQGMRHVRIDLYELNGKIYFGEYTFFHGGGFCLFGPEEWEQKLGSWIDLT